ncbi:MAG: PocR ligand-binding domain-containing protein [Propionicimonas sp.]|nr:PocR ligand-binding domain-containing protein [Propionicimonas sp.]
MAELGIGAVLDMDQLQLVLQDFSEATGLATVAVDTRGVPVTQTCAFTDFCRTVRSDPIRNKLCHGCDAHGGLQSLIEGAPHVYRCHTGLVDFSVPVTDGDKYVGAILCGQVRVPQVEEPDYLTPGSDWRGDLELQELYEQVPISSLRRVAAAAKTLLGLSTGIDGVRHRKPHRELPLIQLPQQAQQPVEPPRPVGEPEPVAPIPGGVLRESVDDEDLAGAYAETSRLLDELFDAHSDPREGLAGLEDRILEVTAEFAPRMVPHLSQMVRRQRDRRSSSPSRYQTQLYFERILAMVLDEVRRSRPHRPRDLRDLFNDIARHPNRALSLTEAATAAHWSPGHLSKVFKSVTGYTFVSYVTLWRISRAQLMLASTQMPVQRIATELDFNQVNYFSRVFRAYTGLSPSEFRRQSALREGRPAGVSLPTHHHALLRA